MGDILHPIALFCPGNALIEALPGNVDKTLGFGADGTTGIGSCTITMESLVKRPHVHGHDVPFLQDVAIRNSVDHGAVDADAYAGGIAVVVQERRFGALPHDKIVDGPVDSLGRYARPYHIPCQSTGCRGNFTGLAHRCKLPFIFDRDHTCASIAFKMSRLASSIDWLPFTMHSLPSFP